MNRGVHCFVLFVQHLCTNWRENQAGVLCYAVAGVCFFLYIIWEENQYCSSSDRSPWSFDETVLPSWVWSVPDWLRLPHPQGTRAHRMVRQGWKWCEIVCYGLRAHQTEHVWVHDFFLSDVLNISPQFHSHSRRNQWGSGGDPKPSLLTHFYVLFLCSFNSSPICTVYGYEIWNITTHLPALLTASPPLW